MARKRDIVARVGADTSEFDSKLGKSGDTLDKLGKLGKSAGLLVAAGLAAAAAAAAALTARGLQLGDALAKSADALGVTVDELAALRHAARLSNVENADLETSIARLARTVSQAAEGQKTYADTFKSLGLEASELKNLPLTEQVEKIADAMNGLGNETDKVRFAQELFGRSGTKLIPLLNQGSDAIRKQGEEARKLGLTLDTVQQRTIQEAADSVTRLQSSVDGLGQQLAGAFAPAITAANSALVEILATVTAAIPKMQALAERFFGIAAAAQDLSDLTLQETLVEQIRAMDELNNRIAEQQELFRLSPGPANEMILNELLDDQAEKQERINELLAERVRRSRAAEEAAKRPTVTDDEPLAGGDDAEKAAAAELALVTAVFEEQERLRQLELEQEMEWRQALFEAREEFNLQEVEAERELVDALLIEQQRYAEELARIDADVLKRKKQVRKETVDNAFAGFTQITAALAAHNEKAFKLNKIAAKAEAGLNAFRAIQQVWADATLPFYAKIAATAITAAATAANIAAINKAEFGGGLVPSNAGATPVVPGGAGLGGQAGGAGGRSQTIFVQGLSEDAIFSGSAVRGLLERLQEALKDGGKLVVQT